MLKHPGDGAVERLELPEPRPPVLRVSTVGVGVVARAVALRPRDDPPKGRSRRLLDDPVPLRPRERCVRVWVVRGARGEGLPSHLVVVSQRHGRMVLTATDSQLVPPRRLQISRLGWGPTLPPAPRALDRSVLRHAVREGLGDLHERLGEGCRVHAAGPRGRLDGSALRSDRTSVGRWIPVRLGGSAAPGGHKSRHYLSR